MKIKGKILKLFDYHMKPLIQIKPAYSIKAEFDALDSEKDYTIEIKPYRKKRSLDQNALMWAIIEEMAKALDSTKDEVYQQMLKRYGESTVIVLVKNAKTVHILSTLKYYDILAEKKRNGADTMDVRVYIGSSEYDSKQMTRLIDGIISECKEMDIWERVKYYSNELKGILEAKK